MAWKPSIWHPIQRRRHIAARNARKRELSDYIDKTEFETFANLSTAQERGDAYDLFHNLTTDERTELKWLDQEDLRHSLYEWGVQVPAEYEESEHRLSPTTLTLEGERWARKALSEARRTWVENWGRALGPYMSALTAGFSAIAAFMSAIAAWAALHRK